MSNPPLAALVYQAAQRVLDAVQEGNPPSATRARLNDIAAELEIIAGAFAPKHDKPEATKPGEQLSLPRKRWHG
jgi:hypothetical protein